VECLNSAVEKGLFKPAAKKVAIYGEETDWGRSVGASFKKEFGNTGWEIVSEDYFPLTQTDFYPLLSKYKRAGVSVICGSSTAAASISAFIKQASEVQLNAVIIADGLGWVGNWFDMTGPSSNYVLDMIPQLTTPEAKEWAEIKKKKYGFSPSPSSSGLSYDGTNLLIKVLKRTLEKHNKLDKEVIHSVIKDELYTGKLTFTSEDGALIMNEFRYNDKTMPDPVIARDGYYFPVIQYMDGKGSIVFPDDWKSKNIEFAK
jgi:branched-chain amino acid transport system substrate-binding protein